MRNRVVLPAPFVPTMPMRAPSETENVMSSKIESIPNDFEILSQAKRIILNSFRLLHTILSETGGIEKGNRRGKAGQGFAVEAACK